MSVVHFSPEELANIGNALLDALLARETVRDRAHAAPVIAARLAKISVANAACYAYRYNEKADPIPAHEILRLILDGRRSNLARAISTATLLHYNCMEDRDFLEETPGAAGALASILESLLCIAAEKAGLAR